MMDFQIANLAFVHERLTNLRTALESTKPLSERDRRTFDRLLSDLNIYRDKTLVGKRGLTDKIVRFRLDRMAPGDFVKELEGECLGHIQTEIQAVLEMHYFRDRKLFNVALGLQRLIKKWYHGRIAWDYRDYVKTLDFIDHLGDMDIEREPEVTHNVVRGILYVMRGGRINHSDTVGWQADIDALIAMLEQEKS